MVPLARKLRLSYVKKTGQIVLAGSPGHHETPWGLGFRFGVEGSGLGFRGAGFRVQNSYALDFVQPEALNGTLMTYPIVEE